MKARVIPGVAARRARTSPITGANAIAGAARSLRHEAGSRSSAMAVRWDCPFSSARPLKTEGVETSTSGLTRMAGRGVKPSSGLMRSPTPCMRQARPPRQTGTSAPMARPAAMISSSMSAMPARLRKPLRAAAALAEPPPMPEATGRFLSRWTATGGSALPRLAAMASAADHDFAMMLSDAGGRAAAKGPPTVIVILCAGAKVSQSPTSAKATIESIS